LGARKHCGLANQFDGGHVIEKLTAISRDEINAASARLAQLTRRSLEIPLPSRWDPQSGNEAPLFKVKESGHGGGRDENIKAKDHASYVGLGIAVQGQ
jgi:hypothetical protein